MTRRQKQLLDLIANGLAREGRCPTYDELRRSMALASRASISQLVMALRLGGLLTITKGERRNVLTLTPDAWELYRHVA
ncbi:MAG: hypothetical protein WDN08_05445 [Rhizomicrobium sp.]